MMKKNWHVYSKLLHSSLCEIFMSKSCVCVEVTDVCFFLPCRPALDHIGHGVRGPGGGNTPRGAKRVNSTGSSTGVGMAAGPAPQSKPPTPPMGGGVRPGSQTSLSASSTGTLGKRSDYRALPVVAPQVRYQIFLDYRGHEAYYFKKKKL